VLAFFTQVDRRRKLHGQIISELSGVRRDVLTTEIPASTVFEQMGVRRGPVEYFAQAHPAAAAYRALWKEVSGFL
jgi:cellulose biosynthesis protein BcsQ